MKTRTKRTSIRGEFAASSAGFSLIELAIGMALVGTILAGALLISGKLWEQERRQETREQLQDSKATILDFARKNGRFPMMDVTTIGELGGDGHEDIIYGNLYQVPNIFNLNFPFGLYPYKDLGGKKTDSLNTPVQYFVNWQLARTETGRPCSALKNLLQGKILPFGASIYTYRDQLQWNNPPLPPAVAWHPVLDLPSLRTPVAAVLVSAGQDKFFNYPNNEGFKISIPFARKPQTPAFDDIVEYISLSEAYSALNCQ